MHIMLLLICLFVCAVAQRRPHSIVTEREIKKRTVDVTGHHFVSIAPDVGFVTLLLETTDKSASVAYASHNKVMNALIADIQSSKVGVPAKDVSTTQFSLTPEYTYEATTNKRLFVGMKTSQTLQVKVRDLTKVSTVLDTSLSSSKNKVQIQSVSFGVENPAKYTVDARQQAIADATKKARVMCESTGMRLGRPISIHEDEPGSGGGEAVSAQFKMARSANTMSADDASSSPQVPQGEVRLAHTVYITFELLVPSGSEVADDGTGSGSGSGSGSDRAAAGFRNRGPKVSGLRGSSAATSSDQSHE
jgi:uncharacterized protein